MKKLLFVLCTLMPAIALADSDVSAEKAAQNTPDGWTAVELPSIPAITEANTFNITAYGASTSAEDNASAIQAAINAVPSAGGMVVIPAGTWMCGPITVKSKLVLHLAAGATLKLLPYGTYPSDNEYQDYRGSYKSKNFISNGSNAINDIIIEGEGETSVIDGQGAPWWKEIDDGNKFDRPSLIRLTKGARHLFRNFKLLNSPGTNLTLGQSGNASHFTVHDVTIKAPKSGKGGSHNTDGIPIWGPYANIYDCYIDTGDDNVVCDSNSRYIHAWNIICGAGHGMSIGSYTEKAHHIIYEGIDFQGTETGFRIKTSNDRSGNDYEGTSGNGSVHDLIFRNSKMDGVLSPIVLTCLYDSDPANPADQPSSDITIKTPEFKNFLFQNITSVNTPAYAHFKSGNPIYIYGRPESYIHDITFDNVQISAQKGMWLAYCKDINFINGCDILNLAGSGDFSKLYEATYTGKYKTTETVTLNVNSTSTTKGAASPWTFDGDYIISNGGGKTYDPSATTPYVKFSAGVQYTISLPKGVYVKAVTFDGFNNRKDTDPAVDAYMKEVNGTEYAATDYVFPGDKSTVSHKIDFATTVADKLTFTPGSKQLCLSITLYTTDTPTGIEAVQSTESKAQSFDTKKVILGGKLVILKNNKKFNIAGQEQQ